MHVTRLLFQHRQVITSIRMTSIRKANFLLLYLGLSVFGVNAHAQSDTCACGLATLLDRVTTQPKSRTTYEGEVDRFPLVRHVSDRRVEFQTVIR